MSFSSAVPKKIKLELKMNYSIFETTWALSTIFLLIFQKKIIDTLENELETL